MHIAESLVEDAALAWLDALGWEIMHGPAIAAGEPDAERGDPNYRDVVLEARLSQSLAHLNPTLSAEALGDGSRQLTRLEAPLLLARRLEDFPDVSRRAPRVVVYAGVSKLETRLDHTGGSGYAVGFQGLIRFVMTQLPQNEVIEDALRKQVKLVPDVVIRELVANALIHQDFTVPGTTVMVELYSNRVEISNPGEPLVPVVRFIDGYQSRNERLADLMRRMGICEEKSSGIDRVVEAAITSQVIAATIEAGLVKPDASVGGSRKFARYLPFWA